MAHPARLSLGSLPLMLIVVPPNVTRAQPVALSSSCTLRLASAGSTRRYPVAHTANCVLYLLLRQVWMAVAGRSGLQE